MTRRRSNTIRGQFQDQQNEMDSADQENGSSQQTVSIILRRTNKVSRSLQVPSLLHIHKLKEILKREFYISEQNQVLFWKGQRIGQSEINKLQTLCLVSGDIINVHSKEIFSRQTAEIYLQFLNSDFFKYKEVKKTVSSQSTISNSLSEKFNLSPEEIRSCVCVQSGRFLNIERTFEEEAIEDESLILLFFEPVKWESLPILQQRQMKLLQSKKHKNKRASQQVIQAQKHSNFKKKLKVFSCKSMILPESFELIWQQDTSDEYDCKNLAKTFLVKKNEMVGQSRFSEIEFNDSKSDTSISEKSIDCKESPETGFKSCDNQDALLGRSKKSISLPKYTSNSCFQQSGFEEDEKTQYTERCLYYPSRNYSINDHERFSQAAFSLHLTHTNEQK